MTSEIRFKILKKKKKIGMKREKEGGKKEEGKEREN